MILLSSSCYKEDDYALTKLDENIILISSDPDYLTADGESYTYLTVEVPIETKKEFSKAIIRTSNGKFDNDKQEIETNLFLSVVNDFDKKIAKTKLKSSQLVEDAIVEVKIGDIYKKKTLEFRRAYPKKINTDLPSLTLSYGFQTINLTTKLSRDIGKPSLNSKASLTAIDSSGTTLGYFLNYTENVNESGILTNQFSLGINSYRCSKIYIIAETMNSEVTTIRDTVSLIIK